MVADLEHWSGRHAVLVVDDFHTLEGTPAEGFIARLVDYAPASLVVLVAARHQPRFNLSRRRIDGRLSQVVGPRPSLPVVGGRAAVQGRLPLALVARRGGRGRQPHRGLGGCAPTVPPGDQRQDRRSPPADPRRPFHPFPAGAGVPHPEASFEQHFPPDLRRFLLDTCVLPRLSGPLCDALLGQSGSQVLLEQAESWQLFLASLEDGNFRCHGILRSYLESVLVAEIGEPETWDRYRRAGRMLEEASAYTDIRPTSGRATTAPSVACCGSGERCGRGTGSVDRDAAHRHRGQRPVAPPGPGPASPGMRPGGQAVESYRSAEGAFGPVGGVLEARHERLALGGWLQPVSPPADDWLSLLREATRRDPLGASARARGARRRARHPGRGPGRPPRRARPGGRPPTGGRGEGTGVVAPADGGLLRPVGGPGAGRAAPGGASWTRPARHSRSSGSRGWPTWPRSSWRRSSRKRSAPSARSRTTAGGAGPWHRSSGRNRGRSG